MKKPITKKQIRHEMDKQIADFLQDGGEVTQVDPGISGRPSSYGPLKSDNAPFQEPKASRTYVPEVIATLEERKKTKAKPSPKPKASKRPRKKIIYDDFGEPLRWEWEE